MDNEKKKAGEIVIEKGKAATWLENYWYHYKWVTLVAAFFLIVFLVCTLQICTRKDKDILVTYAGPISMTSSEKIAIQSALAKNLPKDFAGKNEAIVGLSTYYVLTQEQIEELERQTDSEGYQVYVDKAFNASEQESFQSQLQIGSGSVLFLDKDTYKTFFADEGTSVERFMPLEDVFGQAPQGALDAYGIRLGDTALYKNNPQLSFLSPDTVICLHKKILGQKDYEKEIEAFKAFAYCEQQ